MLLQVKPAEQGRHLAVQARGREPGAAICACTFPPSKCRSNWLCVSARLRRLKLTLTTSGSKLVVRRLSGRKHAEGHGCWRSIPEADGVAGPALKAERGWSRRSGRAGGHRNGRGSARPHYFDALLLIGRRSHENGIRVRRQAEVSGYAFSQGRDPAGPLLPQPCSLGCCLGRKRCFVPPPSDVRILRLHSCYSGTVPLVSLGSGHLALPWRIGQSEYARSREPSRPAGVEDQDLVASLQANVLIRTQLLANADSPVRWSVEAEHPSSRGRRLDNGRCRHASKSG